MAKKAKIDRSQKEFLKAMKKKFQEPEPKPREADHGISRVTPHPTLLPYRRGL